jgi:hypothetical protein
MVVCAWDGVVWDYNNVVVPRSEFARNGSPSLVTPRNFLLVVCYLFGQVDVVQGMDNHE